MNNVIPPMTDPLGRHWKQPSPDKMLIDDEYALMDRHSFYELANYSSTIPKRMKDCAEAYVDIDDADCTAIQKLLATPAPIPDALVATQEAQIGVLQSDANSWQSGYDKGRRMGAKHCMGTIDQLRTNLAVLSKKYDDYIQASMSMVERYQKTSCELAVLKVRNAELKKDKKLLADVNESFERDILELNDELHVASDSLRLATEYRDKLRAELATPAPIPDAGEGVDVTGYRYSRTTEVGRNVRMIRVTKKRCEGWAVDPLMTVAQHKRIVSAMLAASPAAKGGV